MESVSCFVRVVVGSLRDHTAHMKSLLFQTALSSCDCSLTAVCADARLCEQLLPDSARSHTLPDLTHCPERSALNHSVSFSDNRASGAAIASLLPPRAVVHHSSSWLELGDSNKRWRFFGIFGHFGHFSLCEKFKII